MMTETNPYYYYYSNGQKIFSNKLSLTIISTSGYNSSIKFHVPNIEKSFDKLNLLIEPEESLQELYLQRAKSLREKYDYLVLFYSGGSDSHCILETFMLNGIFLDEIIILYSEESFLKNLVDSNSEYYSYLDSEGLGLNVHTSGIPIAKYYVENYSPNTKITYCSNFISEHVNFWKKINNNFYKNVNRADELILNKPVFRISDVNNINPDWRKIKETKKVAHIWGREKPAIKQDNVGYYFFFNDQLFLTAYDRFYTLSEDDLPVYHEFFYIHPTCNRLFLKQAHQLLKKLPRSFFASGFQKIIDSRQYQDTIAKVIYFPNIDISSSSCKSLDIIIDYQNNQSKYPYFKKIISKYGINSIKFRPSFQRLFLENENLDFSINHSNFMKFILNEFFSSKHRDIDIINELTRNISGKKFYIKLF